MQRRMSSSQIQYYMKRLRLFWTQAECADEFEASVLTINRWEKGMSAPPHHRLGEFDEALKTLCRQLHRKTKNSGMSFYSLIADALLEEPPPTWTEPPQLSRDTTFLRELLIEKIMGKTVKSKDILRETDDLGYSRPQVYNTAHRLGITMDNVQPGRGGYSLWSMPKRSKMK